VANQLLTHFNLKGGVSKMLTYKQDQPTKFMREKRMIAGSIKAIMILTLAALLISASPAGVLSAQTGKSERMQLTVAEAIRWIGYLPFYVAQTKGFFEDENLGIKLITAGGRALAVQAVIAGEADISCQDPAGPTQAYKKGANIRIFLPLINRNLIYMVGPKDTPTEGGLDLRGLTIAMATPPSSPYNVLCDLLREKGYEEVDRSTWRPKGSTNKEEWIYFVFVSFFQELPPVDAGRADAAVVLIPYESIGIHDLGLKILYSWAESGPFALTVFDAMLDNLKEKKEAFQRFSNAMVRAYRWMHKNPDETKQIAKKWFPDMNPAVVEDSAERMLKEGGVPESGIVPRDGYQANIFGLADRAGDPGARVPYDEVVVLEFGEFANQAGEK
jgi:NitT/TauT family transport system substrate-binding protein